MESAETQPVTPSPLHPLTPSLGWTTRASIERVIDGDTLDVTICRRVRVRLLDCWAPELRTRDLLRGPGQPINGGPYRLQDNHLFRFHALGGCLQALEALGDAPELSVQPFPLLGCRRLEQGTAPARRSSAVLHCGFGKDQEGAFGHDGLRDSDGLLAVLE